LSGQDDSDFNVRLRSNDPDLISAIKAGHGSGAAEFYSWLYHVLPNHLVRKYGFNREEAIDLASELVLQIYQNLWQYDAGKGTSLIAWVYAVANNKAIDTYRSRRALLRTTYREFYIYELRARELLHRKYPNFEDEILAGLGLIDEEASADHLLVREVFGRSLKEEDQTILLLTLAFGAEDAARFFGLTNNAARQRYRRALRRLRKAFDKAKGADS
jgi:RNA polymerase sigma factor (sigma-70 family)